MQQLGPHSHNLIRETSKLGRMGKVPSLHKRVSSEVVECAHQLARITREWVKLRNRTVTSVGLCNTILASVYSNR
jgi:hypothetical protein